MSAPESADVHAGEESSLALPSRGVRRVGRYLLCDQIGSGGMATIHLARLLGPRGFSRTVAVKQLHPQYAQNPQFGAMLVDEARLAVRIRHGNVISPLDIVATESELFLVMDYVNGESFASLLAASEGPLRPSLAAAILVQALLGLHAAHEATGEQGELLGLVHRDVSPQNILVGQDGVARMLDFGIAKAVARTQTTDGGVVKGKLGYLAPEQIRLEVVDRRTDLFSAGVVLWEALTGKELFASDTLGGSIEQILHAEIAPPSRHGASVTPDLDAVVLKALARDRGARFPDALSMAVALERATPLASALEVIEWVEKLAGPELERRAGLVRRAEALQWESSPVADPGAPEIAAQAAREAGARPSGSEPLQAAEGSSPRTRTLLGLAERRQDVGGSTPMATGVSTGIAVGGDRLPATPGDAKSGLRSRAWPLALGVVLVATAAALGVRLLSSPEPQGFAIARESLGTTPALKASADPAPPAPSPMLDQTPRESPPHMRPAASEASGVARASEPIPPATLRADAKKIAAAKKAVPAKQTAPAKKASALSRVDAKASASVAAASGRAPSAGKKAGPRSDHCTPPWVVNEEQVKVFKAECLR